MYFDGQIISVGQMVELRYNGKLRTGKVELDKGDNLTVLTGDGYRTFDVKKIQPIGLPGLYCKIRAWWA